MPVEISVIVPHLNQPGLLRGLLASLFAQGLEPERFEVIVVDNGSRALPRAEVAAFPVVHLVEEPAPGPGPARNRGAGLARGPLLAFTDSDCTAAPGWLDAILARFAADADLAVLGGDIRMTVASPGDPSPAEAFECVYAYDQRDYIERLGFSVTANLAMRQAVFAAVGPFGGIDVAEDTDWCARARSQGFAVRYAPEMLVLHPARRSMAELRAKWDRVTGHRYAGRRRGAAGDARRAATALATALSVPAELPRIQSTDRLDSPRARARAFRGLAAIRLYRAQRMLAMLVSPAARGGNLQWNRE
jgi:GT2 family glycosyltransferase